MMKQSYPHQIDGAAWLEDHPKALLADEMRLGKTRTALLSLMQHPPFMVICPASAKGVWKDEIRELDRSAVIDVAQGRQHGFNKRADALIINYDVLADHLAARRFPSRYRGATLAVDECHRAKTTTAKRTRATQFFIEEARRAICMSGTPMPSRTAELWPVLYSLGIIRMEQRAFESRYAKGWQAPWGWDARGASNLDELRDMLAPYMLRRTKRQVFGDYVPYESRIITFDRPPDEREGDFDVAVLSNRENPLISVAGLSEVVKESGLRKVPDAIEFIEDRIRESETGKVCVFFWHKEVGKALAKGLAKHKPGFITGETTARGRDGIRSAFRHDPGVHIAGGNILASGEAIDLSVADTSIFVETSWVSKDIRQAAERTESMAKLGKASTAYFLTLENSLDHYMLRRILEKESIINTVVRSTVTTEELLRCE